MKTKWKEYYKKCISFGAIFGLVVGSIIAYNLIN